MPKGQVEEGTAYALPKGVGLPAVLEEIVPRTINWKVKTGPNVGEPRSVDKWAWIFTITEGEYEGVKARCETDAKMTMLDGDLPREIYGTLLDAPVDLGDGFDTDLCLGLPCVVVCAHADPRPKKDGAGFWYDCPVVQVLPEGAEYDENEPEVLDQSA